MTLIEKYDLAGHDSRFYYQFLNRLKMDCEYYLGAGRGYHGVLWTKDEYEQIELMREIYRLLPEPPEWLTEEQIGEINRQMTGAWAY